MHRRTFLHSSAALAASLTLPAFAKTSRPTSQPAAHSPSLLLTPHGLAALATRITAEPFKSQWTALAASVASALARPIDLPPRGGNWSHNYVCPTHGARLRQGKKIGPWNWEHHCPVGPHTLTGDPSKATTDFDGNAIMNIHLQNADLLINAGLLFHIANDDGCATYAKSLLLAYADKYLTYPLHDNKEWPGKGAHVASQPLTEASWLISMAQGADLIWQTLSPADRAAAETKLFRPAVTEILLPSKLTIHNIQCRINSAIGLTGFLLNDQKYIDTAINDPGHGFRTQIAKGINADGMWLEGASGYHFFTIQGLWPLAEAARNNGIDLYSDKLKSMFDAPLLLARPDNVMPDFNDSGDTPLAGHADLYELALARYHDPRYVAVINSAAKPTAKSADDDEAPTSSTPRHNRLALLFGLPTLPPASSLPTRKSQNDTASGYAILQRGSDESATWLCIKYGPHGGGHGHFDKNTFILYSQKSILSPDAGTHAYGSPLHSQWDKTSLAHNTLTVDEDSQQPATGKSLAFGTTASGADFSLTDAGPIYKGITFIRTAAMIDENTLLFIDRISSTEDHTYDLALHLAGTWQSLPDGTPWPSPKKPGYQWFTNPTTRTTTETLTLTTTHPSQSSALSPQSCSLTLAPSTIPTDLITGTGVLKTTEDHLPLILLRRRAQSTTYVWALSLNNTPLTLTSTESTTTLHITLTRNGSTQTFESTPTTFI